MKTAVDKLSRASARSLKSCLSRLAANPTSDPATSQRSLVWDQSIPQICFRLALAPSAMQSASYGWPISCFICSPDFPDELPNLPTETNKATVPMVSRPARWGQSYASASTVSVPLPRNAVVVAAAAAVAVAVPSLLLHARLTWAGVPQPYSMYY